MQALCVPVFQVQVAGGATDPGLLGMWEPLLLVTGGAGHSKEFVDRVLEAIGPDDEPRRVFLGLEERDIRVANKAAIFSGLGSGLGRLGKESQNTKSQNAHR